MSALRPTWPIMHSQDPSRAISPLTTTHMSYPVDDELGRPTPRRCSVRVEESSSSRGRVTVTVEGERGSQPKRFASCGCAGRQIWTSAQAEARSPGGGERVDLRRGLCTPYTGICRTATTFEGGQLPLLAMELAKHKRLTKIKKESGIHMGAHQAGRDLRWAGPARSR